MEKEPLFPLEYCRNIMQTLLDVPEYRQLNFRCRIGELQFLSSKKNLIGFARRYMPDYFFRAMYNVRLCDDGFTVEPCFLRIQQAAWDAALAEYMKMKNELEELR